MNILLQNGDRLLLESGDSVLLEGVGVPNQFVHLSDVDTTGMVDGDVFAWDAAAGKFKPVPAVGIDELTEMVRAAVAEALIAGAAAI